ncbi:PREDICTED: uncharacterized protein LOC108359135 [Rhagoletis zephyria]|uniref:uncharacterized protein LOC108359135 n=1 Tax=Rhagoletis zephyria TaxID=28612 RepID=UPI000811900A|nr:PREDICTED: uncharacterized protein LOC108359135 [Rhagoletis zephyria]
MPKPQEFGKCRLCCRPLSLRYCRAFLAMTPDERYESARVHRYCINCLATSHVTGACDSPSSCHLFNQAWETLEQLQDLVQVSSPQARRQVEDMGPNLIDL